ncbi:hypothetical protein BDB01DRAFT_778437 [Pilobolus umbonatus]|nr:hypothetical protein BDB01DRAFT_778437 [Pilobolus umbonatus]
MDTTPTRKNYNVGIVIISYLVAVLGSMITLELLTRRTHIKGVYNWLLLCCSAISMGGLSIWTMHIIGNQSLTLVSYNDELYHLSYETGFTILSLFSAVITMFVAFVFVGITEEAQMVRIIPSGIIAGIGTVAMHYIGQASIRYFNVRNRIGHIIGSCTISILAVTLALIIFFKLREQWNDQWYRRLGCATLMGMGVCGMHYTALAGSTYYLEEYVIIVPKPIISATGLVAILSSIVLTVCVLLILITVRSRIYNSFSVLQNKSKRRLILDLIFFDSNGRILVNSNGIVPMKEICKDLSAEHLDSDITPFSVTHPFFYSLFQTAIQWSNTTDFNESNTQTSSFGSGIASFLRAANDFADQFHFSELSELGQLHDSVLIPNTISKRSRIFQHCSDQQRDERRASHGTSWLLSTARISKDLKGSLKNTLTSEKTAPSIRSMGGKSTYTDARDSPTVIDLFNGSVDESAEMSITKTDFNDRHIFLVKKVESNKYLINLLSLGYRFAEPGHISRTMGNKLKVPSDYILSYFQDMHGLAESLNTIYRPLKVFYEQYTHENRYDELRSSVFVGLFSLIDETKDPYIIVEKDKRYTIPMVPLTFADSNERVFELTREDREFIMSLTGHTLSYIASSDNVLDQHSADKPRDSNSTLYDRMDDSSYNSKHQNAPSSSKSPNPAIVRLAAALKNATKALMASSSYGNLLASSARLYSDVLDIPAFSARSGPCQLILFRTSIKTAGTCMAINQTLSETIKCIPFSLFRSYAYHFTDLAVEKYKEIQDKKQQPCVITQQRLYHPAPITNVTSEDPVPDEETIVDIPQDVNDGQEISLSVIKPVSSLLPPPRAKRTRPPLLTTDFNYLTKSILLPNILRSSSSKDDGTLTKGDNQIELPILLNVLPTKDRFWWLLKMFEETLHHEH